MASKQLRDESKPAAARGELRVVLADAGEREQRHQMKSSKCGASRRNIHTPAANNAMAIATASASLGTNAMRPSSSASRMRVTSQANGFAAIHGRIDSGTSVSG